VRPERRKRVVMLVLKENPAHITGRNSSTASRRKARKPEFGSGTRRPTTNHTRRR
jgi:hypothetical protein